jgi:hypothetical protein
LVFLIWFRFVPETINGAKLVIDYFAIFGVLALVALVICSLWLGYQIHTWLRRRSKMVWKGIQFYASRKELNELLPLKTFLLSAHHEIYFSGTTLTETILQKIEVVRDKLNEPVIMNFLVLDPDSTLVDRWDEAMVSDTKSNLTSSLKTFCREKQKLPKIVRDRCKIWKYDLIHLNSMIALDPNADDAKLLVEFPLYDMGASERFSILVSRKEQSALYQKLWKHLDFALKHSKEHICPEG